MRHQPKLATAETTGWRDAAACRSEDPELFFPIGSTGPALAQTELAKAVCHACAVLVDCLAWVTNSEPPGQEAGVCAGLSENERRALKRRAARARQQAAATAVAD
jgi:WhiB family redox-sensing transcriptional regulator